MTLAFAPERIEQWPLARLQPYAKNAKTHGADQVAKIAASMADRARPTAEDLVRQRRLGLSMLARTALAGRAAKYDSVRLICRRA